MRTPSTTSAASVQSLLPSYTSIVRTTRRHRPNASIMVTNLFSSILYFISLLTSKLDILLPPYIKSATRNLHIRPALLTVHHVKGSFRHCRSEWSCWCTSITTNIGTSFTDITSTTSWTLTSSGNMTTSECSQSSTSSAMLPTYIAPPNGDQGPLQQIRWTGPQAGRPRHRRHHPQVLQGMSSTSRWLTGGVHRSHGEWAQPPLRAWRDQVDQCRHRTLGRLPQPPPAHPSTSAGYRCDQLQDHILSTSGSQRQDWQQLENCHLDQGWWTSHKEPITFLQARVIAIPGAWAQPADIGTSFACPHWTSAHRHQGPHRSEHLWRGQQPAIISSHLFDQTSISGPFNSNSRILISLRNHETIWSKAHRHIATHFPHTMHIVKWQEEATPTTKTTGRTSSKSSGASTLTTNIMHSKWTTVTIKYSDDVDIDRP